MNFTNVKIAFAIANFNNDINSQLLENSKKQLIKSGVQLENIIENWVPGAVELPLLAQAYAKEGKFDAIICIGTVIKGQTDHYHYVSNMASSGCLDVSLKYHIPVIFGVLTTPTRELAISRMDGTHSNSGKEWALVALDMISIMKKFN